MAAPAAAGVEFEPAVHACNRNDCRETPTVRVIDSSGHLLEEFCYAHAVETAEGLAKRDRFFDHTGREIIKLRVEVAT